MILWSSNFAAVRSSAVAVAASRSRLSASLAALSCESSSATCSCASRCARAVASEFARNVSATPRSLPACNLCSVIIFECVDAFSLFVYYTCLSLKIPNSAIIVINLKIYFESSNEKKRNVL